VAHRNPAWFPSPSKAPPLWEVTECEGIDNCATWSFVKEKGYAKWRTGEEAILVIESFNDKDKTVTTSRSDVAGPRRGFVVTYTGTILNDSQVGGQYTYSVQDRKESGFRYWQF
jgi:hypothetical protein